MYRNAMFVLFAATATFILPSVADAGHVDGMNLYRAYFPPAGLDPSGLGQLPHDLWIDGGDMGDEERFFTPELEIHYAWKGGCGAGYLETKFIVPDKRPDLHKDANGEEFLTHLIVQKVTWRENVEDCDGNKISNEFKVYYESWDIFEVGDVAGRVGDKFYYEPPIEGDSRGHVIVEGENKGFYNYPYNDVFTVGTVEESLNLPSSTTKPPLWDASPPGSKKKMAISWDCCCESRCTMMRTCFAPVGIGKMAATG